MTYHFNKTFEDIFRIGVGLGCGKPNYFIDSFSFEGDCEPFSRYTDISP